MMEPAKLLLHRANLYRRRLWVMTVKELVQLSRDWILVAFMLYAFTVDVYFSGSGVSLQLRNAALAVHDGDRSAASRELIGRLRPPYFSMLGEIADGRQGIELLDRSAAMIVLDIPPCFEECLLRGEPTTVQIQVDATHSVLGFLATSYGGQIVGEFGLEAALTRLGLDAADQENLPLIREENRVWYNPNQNDAWFMSISELLNIITLFSILLPAAALAREKERGTVEQLLVSPLSGLQIMLPKVLAMTAVVLTGMALCLILVIRPVFGVPIKGSLPLFFAVTTLYVLATAGLGLFAATVARNLAQVGMLTVLIFGPMVFLSGAWTPPEAMPTWLAILMKASPLHYYIEAGYGILLKGNGLDRIWPSIFGISVLGAGVFSVVLWRFRRQFQ